jgi:hypothetical protein
MILEAVFVEQRFSYLCPLILNGKWIRSSKAISSATEVELKIRRDHYNTPRITGILARYTEIETAIT